MTPEKSGEKIVMIYLSFYNGLLVAHYYLTEKRKGIETRLLYLKIYSEL